MDIDKLKGTWKKYTEQLNEESCHDSTSLIDLMHRKWQHSIRKLRKSFFFDVGFNIAAIPVVLLIVLNESYITENIKYYFVGFIFLILFGSLGYLYSSFMRIYKVKNYDLPLTEKLNQQINVLNKFIRDYSRITYIIYFTILIIALCITFKGDLQVYMIKVGVGAAVGIGVFFLVIRPFTRFYLKKQFKCHLEALISYLNELTDSSETKE